MSAPAPAPGRFKIMKFGGSSVANADNIKRCVGIVRHVATEQHKASRRVGVVFSAFGGVTNGLLELATKAAAGDGWEEGLAAVEAKCTAVARDLLGPAAPPGTDGGPGANAGDDLGPTAERLARWFQELQRYLQGISLLHRATARDRDLVVGYGELISAHVIGAAMARAGLVVQVVDTREVVVTDEAFGGANVDRPATQAAADALVAASPEGTVLIISGFISRSATGEATTLGRGGSDYTASLFGVMLNAEEIQIYKDVPGIMSAHPGRVPEAVVVPSLSYEEAMELSFFGAQAGLCKGCGVSTEPPYTPWQVLMTETMLPAMEAQVPIRVKCTFDGKAHGTLVTATPCPWEHAIVGVSSIDSVALVSLRGVGIVSVANASARLFAALAGANIPVLLISQSSAGHSISFVLRPQHADAAKAAIEAAFTYELDKGHIRAVEVEPDRAVIAIVSGSMHNTPGNAGKMLGTLADESINVVAIAS
eukprot:gene8880-226_t